MTGHASPGAVGAARPGIGLWLEGLGGWRRHLLACVLGAVLTLALPPVGAVPLAVPAFAGLVLLLGGTRTAWGAFAVGWWFGFAHFLAGLYWIANALLLHGTQYLAVIPIAVGFLPALLAAFVGLAAALTRAVAVRGIARVLVFAVAWTAGEWLRGHAMTGFPWNLAGYVWDGSEAMLQLASLAGIYGLGLLSVAAFAMPALLFETGESRSRAAAALLASAAALAGAYGFGHWRLAGADSGVQPGVVLRVVQPNVPQAIKWDRARHIENFRYHQRLSLAAAGADKVTHVIWPETAVTFFLAEQPAMLAEMAEAVPPDGLILTGVPRRETDGGVRRLRNSLVAVDRTGRIVAAYDKFHLVPLGEYVPLAQYVPLTKVVEGATDYAPGPGPRTLRLGGLPPFSPLICYEVIFPHRVLDRADRPAWLLNVTNDGWYGRSAGPYQHFAIARVRAIEEGVPLVRSANTGISAVVDAHGRVTARLNLGETGVIDAKLPRPLKLPTIYAMWGDWIVLGAAAIMLAAAAGLATRRQYLTKGGVSI